MKKVTILCAVLCLGGTVLSAVAAEQSGTSKQMDMERIGVTGKRYTLPAYSPHETTESAKISTEIIDSEEIKNVNPKDFYDLISRAAGMQEKFQGRKIMNFANIRRGSGMGIVIDGFYIPPNQASRVLAQFPMDAVESVRVIRDSTSLTVGPLKAFASYQSAPNEGFIIITTKKGSRLDAGVVAEYGSLNTRELQLYHGNKIGRFDYRFTATEKNSDGRSGWYNNSESTSLLFNGGYDGSKLKINTMAFLSTGRRNMQIADNTSPTSTNIPYWGYDPLTSFWLALNANMLWTPSQTTSLAYNHGLVEDTEWTSSLNGATGVFKSASSKQSDVSDNYHLWHTAAFGNNTLKVGGQVSWWHEPTGYAAYDGKEREETLVGGYLQDEHTFMGGRLTVDAGVRVDGTYIKKGIDKYSPTQATNKIMENEWTKPVYGGSIGTAYKLDDTYALNARFGFTHANLDSFLATLNNKDLPAEERFKYEAGATAKYHPAFNPTVTLFYYDIKDAKKALGTPVVVTPTYSYNVYDAYNEGLYGGELSLSGVIPYGFNYKLNYSHNESTVDSNNSGSPKDSASLLLGHTYGHIKSNASIRYVAPYKDTTGLEFGNFAKIDVNASYSYKAGNMDGRIMLYARNLMNDNYVTIKNYSDVGTTYGMRLEADF